MTKIKTVKDFLKSYYDNNVTRLQKDYPGLPFRRFLDEYCEFENCQPDDSYIMDNPAFFEKIKEGVPLEYINYKSFFYRNEFYVNQDVLIPRSETEILVEMGVDFIKNNYHEDFSLYDVGTGSGAIVLSIASEIDQKLDIIASDLSKNAIYVAEINHDHLREKINPKTKISFKNQDRLEGNQDKFDLIVSNPPYIKFNSNSDGVHGNVKLFEPHMALYLQDDEYDHWFEILFKQVSHSLKPNGLFIMEGHEDNIEQLSKIAKNYFPKLDIKKDYTQRDRFIIGAL